MKQHFSKRVSISDTDPVGEILRVASDPAIISFAGGLPAPELFPVEAVKEAANLVLEENGATILQYSDSQGFLALREMIAKRMSAEGVQTDAEHIMIATGSQQVIDLTSKLFLDENDVVIVEKPTYLCAMDVFKSYGAKIISIEMDEHGMKTDVLEKVLAENPQTKLIYTIPTFQNPTGRTLTLERRKKIAELAAQYQVMVLEDNPYGAIRFAGEELPTIQSFDQSGHVIYTSTFSKILAPGLRIGWVVTSPDLIKRYTMMKQSADLHSDVLSQAIITKFFEKNDIDAHIKKISQLYHQRYLKMQASIDRYFPSNVKTSRPEGGMFIWVEVPGVEDTQELFEACIQRKVAFVPGDPFYDQDATSGTFRLNYSNMSEEQIEIGIKRLGELLKEL
ncbi:aminotransferase-like domain-containing protein [Enterococcus sp. LJL99]